MTGSVRLVRGNLLDSRAVALVNPVNTHGVMGAGLAREFKRAYPGAFAAYKAACDAGQVRVGRVHLWRFIDQGRTRMIVHLPTKKDWRRPSQLAWVAAGLFSLRAELDAAGVPSVAIPALGCGLGGLPWEPVRNAVLAAFVGSDVKVELYAPGGTAP